MKVEYIIVSAPLQQGGPSEDAVVVSEAGGGRSFFAVIVDAHGQETDQQGKILFKSYIVADYAYDIAWELCKLFKQFPNSYRFHDHFDSVAKVTDSIYRPKVEAKHEFAQLFVGAVVSCVVVTSTQIHLAQTGDCRLYTARPSWELGFRRLSHDHNANNPTEIDRLRPFLRSGDFRLIALHRQHRWFDLSILTSGTPDRLFRRKGTSYVGCLEPTRVFGDWEFQPAVTHVPECNVIELSEFAPGELFALCSDGGNKIVEAVFKYFRGQTQSVPLEEIAAFARSLLPEAKDDVTNVFFRVVSA